MTEPDDRETEQSRGRSPGESPETTRKSAFGDPNASVIEQMGGVRGLVFSSIPVLTFVPVNQFWGLTAAMWAALGVAVAMLGWSLIRRDNPQPAISGFIGVAICVFIAWRTGTAEGYFAWGIITQVAYGVAFLVSILVRWPLVGVIWGFLEGKGMTWRRIPAARRWYAVATWFWVVLFAGRAIPQTIALLHGEVTWLAGLRIGMGWPLAVVAFAGTVWAVRRAMGHEEDALKDAEDAVDRGADSTEE